MAWVQTPQQSLSFLQLKNVFFLLIYFFFFFCYGFLDELSKNAVI